MWLPTSYWGGHDAMGLDTGEKGGNGQSKRDRDEKRGKMQRRGEQRRAPARPGQGNAVLCLLTRIFPPFSPHRSPAPPGAASRTAPGVGGREGRRGAERGGSAGLCRGGAVGSVWGCCGAVVGPAGVGAVWGLCGTCTGPVWDMRGLRRIHMGPAWVRSLLKALWGPWDPCRPDPPPLSGA